MKKSILARGFIGSVASLLGVLAVGCGADVGPEGAAGDSAEIGSVEQAIGSSHAAAYTAAFPAAIKLSATEVLLVGGESNDTPTSVTTIKKYDKTNGAVDILGAGSVPIALNTPRAEAQIVEVASNVFAVIGGRNGLTRLDTAEIINLNGTPSVTALANNANNKLASARTNFKVTPCKGDFLISGGLNGSDAAENKLEVFHYDSGTPSASTILELKNNQNETVTFTARAFHEAIEVSASRILLVGGESGSVLGDSKDLTLGATCVFNSNDETLPAGPSLPSSGVMTRMIQAPISKLESSVTYDVMLAGGENASGPTTTTYMFDKDTAAFLVGPSLATGIVHSRPALSLNSTSDWAIVGGESASGLSVTSVNYWNGSTFDASPSPQLSTSRLGAFAAFIGSAHTAGMGVTIANPGPTFTYRSTVE